MMNFQGTSNCQKLCSNPLLQQKFQNKQTLYIPPNLVHFASLPKDHHTNKLLGQS
jgi:hypothetical protein